MISTRYLFLLTAVVLAFTVSAFAQPQEIWDWKHPVRRITGLADVAFTDAAHGTVVGSSGQIMGTTDGGATWVQQSSGTTVQLLGVAFVDRGTGVAVGGYGTILGTTDGGRTWIRKDTRISQFLYDVAFNSSGKGIAVGEGG